MTSTDHGITQAWPACALGAWAASWVGGHCSPDDVVDTLASTSDLHVVVDHSETADSAQNGILALLGLLRSARRMSVRLPGAGDPQGLPPDPATTAALAAGEVLLIDDSHPTPLALIPSEHDGSCRWTVLRFGIEVGDGGLGSPGELEYELRQAVSSATTLIAGMGGRTAAPPVDLRGTLRSQTRRHIVELPPHDDRRLTRIIETSAQVEAIVALAGGAGAGFGSTAGHWSCGDAELRRLTDLAHAARAASVNRLISDLLGRTW